MPRTKKILIALTSHGELGDTGRPTGFYLPEVAQPWKVFTDHGYEVDLVSVRGGEPPMIGHDTDDPVHTAFLADAEMSAQLAHTPRPDQVSAADYDAVYYAGGHGTMWDFTGVAPALARLATDIYEAGGVVSALCHGPAALLDIRLSDGTALVEGKRLTAFTNEEEAAVELTDVVPFALQDALQELGAKHEGAKAFTTHVVVDGRLVTGQNPASATAAAEAVVRVLSAA
ncbi:type 1 glutamine amidotransferase domain-containing protein [Streptomyces sp. NPDC006458]|uniref:type 1 glutamine amidotransferase domain-containing protein n=1 Tax=Streptomyces sp. NPDC006458 TaxID=3154302 RepID=UPI0033A9F29B